MSCTKDYTHINAWDTFLPDPPLTPSVDFGEQLFSQLQADQLIVVCPHSIWKTSHNSHEKVYSLHELRWHPRVGIIEGDMHETVTKLEAWLYGRSWSPRWDLEWRKVGEEIVVDECWAYLGYVLKLHGLHDPIPGKLRSILHHGLTLFAANQLFRLIWRTVKQVAEYRMREGLTTLHAINTVPGQLHRTIEWAHSQRWQIRGYDRPTELPSSIITSVFFSAVLHHEACALSQMPAHWTRPSRRWS